MSRWLRRNWRDVALIALLLVIVALANDEIDAAYRDGAISCRRGWLW